MALVVPSAERNNHRSSRCSMVSVDSSVATSVSMFPSPRSQYSPFPPARLPIPPSFPVPLLATESCNPSSPTQETQKPLLAWQNSPLSYKPPSLWRCARPHVLPFVLVALCLGAASVGLFMVDPTWWYFIAYIVLVQFGILVLTVWITWYSRKQLTSLAQGLHQVVRLGANAYNGPFSDDAAVQYLQDTYLQAILGVDSGKSGPLDFLKDTLKQLDHSKDGCAIVDTSGVILYANRALCTYFGREEASLLSENVRVLMPDHYAQQHDQFLRRHMETGECKVLGSSREVPVVDSQGRQSVVRLSVEDRIDPNDPANRLFVGRMAFHTEDPLFATLRIKLLDGNTSFGDACHPLDGCPHAVVITDIKGIVQFINTAACTMLGWSVADINGQNVKILMGEPFASAHDGFLAAYEKRVTQARQEGRLCNSSIVGSGRDTIAKNKDNQSVRVFLTVLLLDRPSHLIQDCVLVARMVPLTAPGRSQRNRSIAALSSTGSAHTSSESVDTSSQSHRRSILSTFRSGNLSARSSQLNPRSPSHRARIIAVSRSLSVSSQVIPGSGRLRHVAAPVGTNHVPDRRAERIHLNPLKKMKCTVVVVQASRMSSKSVAAVQAEYESLLSILMDSCTKHMGVLQWILGDTAVVTFNVALPNSSHRSNAANFALHVSKDWKEVSTSSLLLGAACDECYSVTWGAHHVLIGEVCTIGTILVRVAMETNVQSVIIDETLFSELRFSYTCRPVNTITLYPNAKEERRMVAYELMAMKHTTEDEWMYQLAAQDVEAESLRHWQECWDTMSGATSTDHITAALGHLDAHLHHFRSDSTATWLQAILVQHQLMKTGGPVIQIAGSIPYSLRWALDPTAGGPLSPGSHRPVRRGF